MSQSVKTSTGHHQVKAGDTSLLDTLERTGHKVEYQCRQGYCGACRTQLLAGTVVYQSDPLAAVGSDTVLPCCCLPEQNITLAI